MLGSPRGVTSSSVMASSVAYIPFRDVTLRSNILHDWRLTICTNTYMFVSSKHTYLNMYALADH